MAVKLLVYYPEDETILRKKSEPVRAVNRRIKNLVKDLKETLRDHGDGIGLAAPQIGIHSRVVVVRLGDRSPDEEGNEEARPGPPIALINPEIVEAGQDRRDFDGCLSLPGLYAETVRPHYLKVTGLDEWGRPFERVFEGFDAVVVHHEIDHLDGVLFIDRVQSVDDLYQVRRNEKGELVRVPVTLER
jgi:peptide deformylase